MLASDRQVEIIKRAIMHLSINLSLVARLTLEPTSYNWLSAHALTRPGIHCLQQFHFDPLFISLSFKLKILKNT